MTTPRAPVEASLIYGKADSTITSPAWLEWFQKLWDGKSIIFVVGLPVYANNAAAIAGGLSAGAFYRTGADPDPVCVVH